MICSFCGQNGAIPIMLMEGYTEIKKIWPSIPSNFNSHGVCKEKVRRILISARKDWEKEKNASGL